MPGSAGDRGFNRRTPRVAAFFIIMLVGLLGFYRVTQSAQFATYRTVDVAQLVVSGACLGAALVGVMVMLLRPHN